MRKSKVSKNNYCPKNMESLHYTLKDHQGSLEAGTYTMRVTLEGGKVFTDKVVKE